MTSTHPANAPSREVFADAIERIEAINRNILSEHMEYMRRIAPLKADIAEVVDEAKGKGVRSKVLKAEVKRRDHLRKADEAVDKLEEDEDVAQFDYLRTLFGKDAELPLFASAADKHESAVREAKTGRRRKTAAGLAADKGSELDELTESDPRPEFLKERHAASEETQSPAG